LRLNIVCKSDVSFLDPDAWKACDSPAVEPSDRRGRPLYLGGDLSRTTDLTALAAIWGDEDEGYDAAFWFWMPEDNVKALEQRDRVPYQHWIDRGFIVATPGSVVDYESFRRQVNDLAADHDLRSLLLDPYNATQLAIRL